MNSTSSSKTTIITIRSPTEPIYNPMTFFSNRSLFPRDFHARYLNRETLACLRQSGWNFRHRKPQEPRFPYQRSPRISSLCARVNPPIWHSFQPWSQLKRHRVNYARPRRLSAAAGTIKLKSHCATALLRRRSNQRCSFIVQRNGKRVHTGGQPLPMAVLFSFISPGPTFKLCNLVPSLSG